MKMINIKFNIYAYILIIIIFVIIYYSFEININAKELYNKTSINNDGFIILNINNKLNDNLNLLEKTNIVKKTTLKILGNDYIFLDYKYYIQGCSLSTFHRDVTSSQTSINTKNQTYTAILYEYDGDFVSICKNSHKTYPFTFSKPLSIYGEKNTLIIFNSDMLHAGIINKIGKKRKVLQFKIVHKNDFNKLKHLNNINVNKIGKCNLSYTNEFILRKLSYYFSFIINTTFRTFLIDKKEEGIISKIQDKIPIKFYNNI